MRTSRPLRSWVCLRLTACLAALLAASWGVAPARAQDASSPAGVLEAEAGAPEPRVRARELARVLGASLSEEGEVLVLRRGELALTMFDGSSEGVVAGREAATATLSGPAQREAEGWWVPLDAGGPFGLVRTAPDAVRTADGRHWTLRVRRPAPETSSRRARVVAAAPGVSAVEILADGPTGQRDAVSLWMTDLALAALVVPEARAELDTATAEAGSARALLGVVTSRVENVRAEPPSIRWGDDVPVGEGRAQTLAGRPEAIGPDAPWTFVLWLPAGARLDGPLTVAWRGERVEVVFRR